MILKGQKRKLPSGDVEVSELSGPLWESQRQFVFSVSMNKYQRSQELLEPSLRRSVLIANTLRQISLDSCTSPSSDQEVSEPPSSSSFSPQEKERGSILFGPKHHSAVTADGSYAAPACCSVVSLNYVPHNAASRSLTNRRSSESNVPVTVGDEDWGLMSTDSDFSLSAAISSILTALDSTMDGGPQASPRAPLRSLENLYEPSDGGVASVKQGSRDYSVSWEREVNVRNGYVNDITMDDLFQDIDASQLEKDMGVLGLRSNGCSAGDDIIRYLPPLCPSSSSLSLNSNVKCLPSFSSFSPSSSSSSSPASASFSGQNPVREGFELEQLMEILVES